MANGEICCAAGVCCPSAQARKKFSDLLQTNIGCDAVEAAKIADWVHDEFDLMPKGNGLGALVAYVSAHVKPNGV